MRRHQQENQQSRRLHPIATQISEGGLPARPANRRYPTVVIRRLYIHNFRCLENFELSLIGQSSILLIGKNGSGKSSIALALEFLQKIARGANAIDQLVKVKDFSRGRADVPMRFEIETQLDGKIYSYSLAIELPPGSRGLRVMEEHLEVDGREIFSRRGAQVHLSFAFHPPRQRISP